MAAVFLLAPNPVWATDRLCGDDGFCEEFDRRPAPLGTVALTLASTDGSRSLMFVCEENKALGEAAWAIGEAIQDRKSAAPTFIDFMIWANGTMHVTRLRTVPVTGGAAGVDYTFSVQALLAADPGTASGAQDEQGKVSCML